MLSRIAIRILFRITPCINKEFFLCSNKLRKKQYNTPDMKGEDMSKAILILDEMPECCEECPAFMAGHPNICKARVFRTPKKNKFFVPVDDINKKPEWCLLKPMPERFTDYVQCEDENDEYEVYKEISENGERRGWNMCIDEIMKG